MNANSKDPILFLFTSQYPYGTGETFIDNELAVLSPNFSKIFIFPLTHPGSPRSIPANVELVNWSDNFKYNGRSTFLKYALIFIKIFTFEFYHTSQKFNFLKQFFTLKSMLLQNIARAMCVSKFINKSLNNIFYTFWFDDWATVLGILKEKHYIPGYHSRVHGFDLYAERREGGLIPFRNFQLGSVKTLFPVSKSGADYLTTQFPSFSSKIKLSYLGVFDNGMNPFKEENKFTLVSCSNMIPIKRIHLIIEILRRIPVNLNWIHFGDGILKSGLLEQVKMLPANISVDFRGQVTNSEVINFYRTQPVHLFISTSETEGLPVSIQEAISFGIPVIATNVGGISEIVNEQSGFLIKKDFNPDEVAQLILTFKDSSKNSNEFRLNVRKYWEKNFNASVNYQLFCTQLLKG